jgi:predicted DNA-binding transcriptional regulator YafY
MNDQQLQAEDFDTEGTEEATKRLVRVLSIVTRITNAPRYWTRRKLAEKFELSERQIDKDLQLIRNGLCYEMGRTREGYYFTRAPELRAIQYTTPEALTLIGALHLARGTGAIDVATLGAALARTEEALPGPLQELVRPLRQPAIPQTSRQRHRAQMAGLVLRAMAEQYCLSVEYESASRGGARTMRVLRPYVLTPHEGSWMLTAHDSIRETVRDFKVDRIHRATVLDERYTIPDTFDLARYKGSGWGALRGAADEPVEVVLHFNAEEGRRVRDEQWHESQGETPLLDGGWEMTFHVGINDELVRWIFHWGTGCKVIAPPELRARVAAQARAIAAVNGEEAEIDRVSNFAADGGKAKVSERSECV